MTDRDACLSVSWCCCAATRSSSARFDLWRRGALVQIGGVQVRRARLALTRFRRWQAAWFRFRSPLAATITFDVGSIMRKNRAIGCTRWMGQDRPGFLARIPHDALVLLDLYHSISLTYTAHLCCWRVINGEMLELERETERQH
jgi:hypothetical protein